MSLVALGTMLIDGIVSSFRRRQEIKHAEHTQQVKRIEQGDASAARLDELSLANRGWKDDYLLIITTLPLVLLFAEPIYIAWLDTYHPGALRLAIQAGFNALDSTPDYYWYALAVIYIDTFGFRRMGRVALERWLSHRFK